MARGRLLSIHNYSLYVYDDKISLRQDVLPRYQYYNQIDGIAINSMLKHSERRVFAKSHGHISMSSVVGGSLKIEEEIK